MRKNVQERKAGGGGWVTKIMEADMNGEYLRQKARTLELIASSCFDGGTAQRLRHLADEFRTAADRRNEPEEPEPFMVRPMGHLNGGLD
jgi:hypothetical protein